MTLFPIKIQLLVLISRLNNIVPGAKSQLNPPMSLLQLSQTQEMGYEGLSKPF